MASGSMPCLATASLDIDNAFSVVAEGLVSGFREQEDYEGFKLACIVNLARYGDIAEDEFKTRRPPNFG